MGANAQTSVPLFTAGEVLTAANQNISAGTGVPVFATTVTRDAAFGGSGEKVLAEGQLAYIEADNVVQYYDGASWATVGPATASACVQIVASTAFTTASTINVNNVFTNTYRKFTLLINTTAKSTSMTIFLKMRVGGADSSTFYYAGQMAPDMNSAATIYGSRANNGSSGFPITNANAGNSNPIEINFLDAPVANPTGIYGNFYDTVAAQSYQVNGQHQVSTAYDGFSIITSTGTITGTYSLLGFL